MTIRSGSGSAAGMRRRPARVVLVDHADSYTWNLAHLVAAVTGELPAVVPHDRTTVQHVLSFDYVVLSAGPGHPDTPADLGVSRDVLLAAQVPVLGVCLGMQGLASAFGGRVVRASPAHGRVSAVTHDATGVFAGLPSPFSAVRYHSLVAQDLGPDLRATATCDDASEDRVTMGISHRTRPLHGVQFHPESILSEFGTRLMGNFLSLADRDAR